MRCYIGNGVDSDWFSANVKLANRVSGACRSRKGGRRGRKSKYINSRLCAQAHLISVLLIKRRGPMVGNHGDTTVNTLMFYFPRFIYAAA